MHPNSAGRSLHREKARTRWVADAIEMYSFFESVSNRCTKTCAYFVDFRHTCEDSTDRVHGVDMVTSVC